MNEFDKRIQKLSEEIADARFKVDTTLRSTAVFYIIMIVVMTLYTLYVGFQAQEMATPKTVAIMIGDSIRGQMPQLQKKLVSQAKLQAPVMAGKTIDLVEKVIPRVEDVIKTRIDATVEMIVESVFTKMMPQLAESIKGNFDEISKHKSLVSDKKTAEVIADILSAKVAEEMDKITDHNFYNRLNQFQAEIDLLAQKAPSKLTQRELAEKQIIIYWLYLVENAEPGNGPVVEILRFASQLQKAVKK